MPSRTASAPRGVYSSSACPPSEIRSLKDHCICPKIPPENPYLLSRLSWVNVAALTPPLRATSVSLGCAQDGEANSPRVAIINQVFIGDPRQVQRMVLR